MTKSGRAATQSLLVVSCLAIGIGGSLAASKSEGQTQKKTVEFNRDVRPILANNCFKCHGHDPAAIQAGLRLDMRDVATSKLKDGRTAIVPGHPEQSELVRRINADPDDRMPPPDTHKILSEAEKKTLEQWVKEGAEYKDHWAFVPVVRPAVPDVKDKAWPRNPIDNFILAKLEENGLKPSPEADKSTLLRRVSIDLTGLPPTPKELDDFLSDKSPGAYEKVVDRLLASNRYGEHMTSDWMDIARYADSNGYQADYERYQWRWRDWVIDAFNKNEPYNQFIIDQVAGDMLPNATLDQKMATGFGRNHRINTEGGVIAEEWRVENVIDRVETTTQAFIGLTAGCARCHDHKFDPITQKDFYRLFAFFNNIPESGTGEERPINHPPTIKAPYPVQTERLAAYDARLKDLDAKLNAVVEKNIDATSSMTLPPKSWPVSLSDSLVARWQFGPDNGAFTGNDRPATNVPKPKVVGMVKYNPGRSTGAVQTDKDSYLDLGQVGDYDKNDAFSYGAWVYSENGRGAPFAKMDTANDYRGWDAMFIDGVVLVHIINKFPTNTLKAITKTPFPAKVWTHLMITYDGSMKPDGLHVYINGKASELTFELNTLTDTIRTPVPLTIGRRTGSELFTGQVDDFQLYSRALKPEEVAIVADVNPAKPLLAIPAEKRSPAQKKAIAKMVLLQTDKDFAKTSAMRDATSADRAKLDAEIPTVMVMQEMPKPRDAFILKRGQYDHPGDKVTPGVPEFLTPLPKGAPDNRLGLAEWLASPENPLTARVAVNRWWERMFGTGIVETVEDFGTRASFPTHPELLDWMASEFVGLNWNIKAMLKEIVMSATYRQSSAITEAMLKVDPQNKLLERGPRFRMNAEIIRDQALSASGLLFTKIGGPSVRPYQPTGIWDETNFYGNLRNYTADSQPGGLYRRSMYTIWKRTAAPPNMLLFDAPTRETCRVRRARTDTPLQALTLMNDETYLEASRVLAERAIKEGGTQPADWLRHAFRLVLSREPDDSEMTILKNGYAKRLAKFKTDPTGALSVISQGVSPVNKTLDTATLAAMSAMCTTILNLDEAVTKE